MYPRAAADTMFIGILMRRTLATMAARMSSPMKVSMSVGRSRNPEPARAKYALAIRPSSENWKKRSTDSTGCARAESTVS